MLIRQKIVLNLLAQADKSLSPTVFVKLMFLLRQEPELRNEHTFYDFVPYKYGPFSFTLYRELINLRRDGYITPDKECIGLREHTAHLASEKIEELSASVHQAINRVVSRHGKKSRFALVKDVYAQYPWYATKSELTGLRPKSLGRAKKVQHAVYTAGYEGKSVDSFFNLLLKQGIGLIIDVRVNAVSRRHGFSKKQFSDITMRLGLVYRHIPALGIPSNYRVNLTDFDSYQRLLNRYEREMLSELDDEIHEVGNLMQETPAVLVCVEKDVRCCHRSRLAEAVSRKSGLKVTHL